MCRRRIGQLFLACVIIAVNGVALYESSLIIIIIIIIIIRNLYSAIMPLGGYRGAGGTGR